MPVAVEIALGILAVQATMIVFCLSMFRVASLAERRQLMDEILLRLELDPL